MASGARPEAWQARRQRTPARLTAPDPQAPATSNDTYVLGNDAVELEQLRLQHGLWRPILLAALASWPRIWPRIVGPTILEVRARRT
ncbi:hypothetical protein [Cyanobium sp. N5-Cardenillas]|uniref:hypothetical protein n=1 Tax=Cyanobium sp. N5-Cardenillas TaxID=2823720 RepID=UPI0020CF0FE5|nr:hypothetical protein [Cyanobium sp. N5-Cardenillas]MCP9786684.1 hypothetical protein [Cyanobium sp. N5-Cardenillas]